MVNHCQQTSFPVRASVVHFLSLHRLLMGASNRLFDRARYTVEKQTKGISGNNNETDEIILAVHELKHVQRSV